MATEGRSAKEIRNLTQEWVLQKPVIKIGNKSYQVDATCSVILNSFEDPDCDVIESTTATRLPVSVSMGLFLTLIFIIMIALTVIVLVSVRCLKCKNKTNLFQHSTVRYVYNNNIYILDIHIDS